MYPGSIFELIDQSQIATIPESTTVNNAPVFMQAFGSDKGPEAYRLVQGDEFFDLYGADLSKAYKKYGQPLIQAAAIINAGGRLYAKRVVPNDATLANVVIGAKVEATKDSVKVQLVKANIEGAVSIDDIRTSVEDASFSFAEDYESEVANFTEGVSDKGTENVEATGLTITTELKPGEVNPDGGSIAVDITGSLTYGGEKSSTMTTEVAGATYEAIPDGETSTTVEIPNFSAYALLSGKGVVDLYRGTLVATMNVDAAGDKITFTDVKLYTGVATTWTTTEEATITSSDEIESVIDGTKTEGTFVFPLYIVADNGRGVSGKNFVISHDVTSSKSMDKAVYNIKVYDTNEDYNGIQFVLDPSATNGDNNISFANMVNYNSTQLVAYQYDDSILDFIAVVDKLRGAEAITNVNSGAGAIDYLFGNNKVGKDVDVAGGVAVSGDNTLFVNGMTVALEGGTNGDIASLGDSTKGWNCKSAFQGETDYTIFDLDNVKIDAIADANYDTATKNSILRLANFREDFVFLRDLGINGLKSMEAVKTAASQLANSKFQMVYGQYFDIRDPYSKRQATVTITYDIVRKLVSHMVTGRHCPVAGLLYGFVCDSALEGTVSFIPVIRPGKVDNGHNYYSSDAINEKADLEDVRVNFASYINGDLVVETEYNNQAAFSQFSYGNNIFGIQEVIKTIRSRCPKSRYSWLDGQDLENYKTDVNGVLEQYADNYKTLTFEYIEDTTYVSNKIFYGAIKVQFRNFVQTEYFKVIALPS